MVNVGSWYAEVTVLFHGLYQWGTKAQRDYLTHLILLNKSACDKLKLNFLF